MKLFFIAALLTGSAVQAQEHPFDLTDIPDGFSFVSTGALGVTTLSFMRRDRGNFVFEQSSLSYDGEIHRSEITTNVQSQTLIANGADYYATYSPHDCAPAIGVCSYTWKEDGDTYRMRRDTYFVGEVWVYEEQFETTEGAWVFWEKGCVTYDEYGFWIDYVYYDEEGEYGWGARTSPALVERVDNRMERLRNICEPRMLLSKLNLD